MVGSDDDDIDAQTGLEKRQKLDDNDQSTDLQSKIKFFEDLNKIKERKEQMKENLKKVDRKEVDALLKEKDKLEMQAMVLRMQERDKKNKEKLGVESNEKNLTKDEIEQLRKTAREKYLIEREERQLKITKDILDDQEKMFASQAQNQGTLIDMLLKNEKGGSTHGLTDIERRQFEIDQKLYALANKHRETYKDQMEAAKGYQMPDAYNDDDNNKKIKDKMSALTKRYEEEVTTLTEQEMWERDQQKKTIAQFGTKKSKEQKQYDLLIEN